ncbi:MAG TPA: hypothetical protein VGF36_14820 [Rhodopila sp.]
MIFDQATDAQMRAAQIFTLATTAAFVAAPMFRHRAKMVRLVTAGLYIAGALGFLLYLLL